MDGQVEHNDLPHAGVHGAAARMVRDAGDVGVATEKLRKMQQALKELELRYASNKWSVIVPIRALQGVFR